jgi:16S rRNA (guanine527-N7)-methyltransferase
MNLTGARTPEERSELLVAQVLPALDLVQGPRLIDVGSGNGSPGLVLALLCPELEVTLLEPRQRRWAFLREARRVAGCTGVEVLRVRHDRYAGPPADNVTMRGLDVPLEELAPLVRPGGRVVVFGGPPRRAEGFCETAVQDSGQLLLRVYRRPEGGVPSVPRET